LLEDERWKLYVVSKDVDVKGPLIAYRAVADALRHIPDSWVSMSDVKLVGGGDAIVRDLLDVLKDNAGRLSTRHRRPVIGGVSVEEAYVYPAGKRPHTELNEEQKLLLETIYFRTEPASVDDLPYTEEMERIHCDFVQQTGLALTTRDVFKALKNLGRQGRLGGKIRTQSQPDANLTPPSTPPAAAG
jgi:hypothetical protein